jgi:hypothetical protein
MIDLLWRTLRGQRPPTTTCFPDNLAPTRDNLKINLSGNAVPVFLTPQQPEVVGKVAGPLIEPTNGHVGYVPLADR